MLQKQKKQQKVIIKGTKDGLTFFLNDQCSFDSLILELDEKISERPNQMYSDGSNVSVKLVTGNRYLEENQIQLLENSLFKYIHGVIDEIQSNVVSKKESEDIRNSYEVSRLVKVIRSGQVINIVGDLLLIGDVNPGGTIKATGNIFVMGKLAGIAHAGCDGNNEAVICAASMVPSQLRIADVICRPPEKEKAALSQVIECAYLDDSMEMLLDPIQKLVKIRPKISSVFDS